MKSGIEIAIDLTNVYWKITEKQIDCSEKVVVPTIGGVYKTILVVDDEITDKRTYEEGDRLLQEHRKKYPRIDKS